MSGDGQGMKSENPIVGHRDQMGAGFPGLPGDMEKQLTYTYTVFMVWTIGNEDQASLLQMTESKEKII